MTEEFRDAIRSAGLEPPGVIDADGKLHRFSSNGKRGDDAGWYILYDDGVPAGCFGDWRTGIKQSWRADIDRALSAAEESAHRAKVETMRRERVAEEARRHAEARSTARARKPPAVARDQSRGQRVSTRAGTCSNMVTLRNRSELFPRTPVAPAGTACVCVSLSRNWA